MKKIIVGLDLGGTKIAAAAATPSGQILSEILVPTEANKGKERVIHNMIKAIDTLARSLNAHIACIGVGVPGPIDYQTGIVNNPPNLPGWKKVNLKRILGRHFKANVHIENDANAAAYGEALFGAGKYASDFLYITVSTGIGGGIIINRQIYRGKDGSAGEFGHMIIDPNGFKCGCGNHGCFEAMASGTSVKTRSGEDAMAVHIRAQQGDKKAIKVIEETGKYLGIGIANLVNIFNPEMVVIGGGMSNLGEMLLKPARKEYKKHVLSLPSRHMKIIRAKLKDKSGLYGAIALCL